MPLHISDDWRTSIDGILADPGLTVILGNTDSGKTSFCLLLANAAVGAGISAAVVDGDTGQSEIGIPGVMGMGVTSCPVDSLREIKPSASYFIGSTTPVDHLLLTVTGMRVLADKARDLGCGIIITDTCGYVQGIVARRLNTSLLEILSPKHIVAIQKAGEMEPILRYFDTWRDVSIHRLPVSPDAHPKSPILRRQRRSVHFQEYFLQGRIHQIPLNSVALSGTWLGVGDPLEPRLLKFAETSLRTNVFYGEESANGIYLVTSGEGEASGMEALQEHFRKRLIVTIPASRYVNLLVGMMDNRHNLLGCGIIQRIDFIAQTLSIYSPIRTVVPVQAIRFGSLKIRADGIEIGLIHPGEV